VPRIPPQLSLSRHPPERPCLHGRRTSVQVRSCSELLPALWGRRGSVRAGVANLPFGSTTDAPADTVSAQPPAGARELGRLVCDVLDQGPFAASRRPSLSGELTFSASVVDAVSKWSSMPPTAAGGS
jgi:hypothetical protein